MKKRVCLLLSVMAAVMCLGMGGGGQGGIEIPEPARDFSAALVDRSGLSIVLNRFSCDGSTFFFGKMGMADASVDFDRIRSAAFEKAADGTVSALIQLKDGDTVRLVMKGDMACYGASTVADVRILLADIQNLEIQGGDE
jgi:hypothetical protein